MPVMERARCRIDQLRLQGALSPRAARGDLRTIDYLERHPDRKFPRELADWILEIGRFFRIGDPGPYLILRILVLDGALDDSQRDRALRRCMVVVGIPLALLQYGAIVTIACLKNFSGPRPASWENVARLANLGVLVTAGVCATAFVSYFILRAELRKLQASIERLD